ncbi:MAG: pyridoxamine 5'-phosphate oxidase family protein [Dehalococcoidia bacterium]|nr:pyridoxamine 5'-phosphate oxidase family protein [Dehalococcoidia bacterium]
MPIDLTEFSDAINIALEESSYCVVATCGPDGPDVGYKASMQVFDRDHLSYWERTRGQHLANLRSGPRVVVMYFNRERGKYLRMYGRAELHEEGPVRDEIMARSPEPELAMDPERKGVGVLIRIDRLEEAFGRISQRRDST